MCFTSLPLNWYLLYCQLTSFQTIWEENDDNRSVYCDTLTPGDWETLEELYNLTKLFRDFTVHIEGHALTSSHRAL